MEDILGVSEGIMEAKQKVIMSGYGSIYYGI